MLPRCFTFIFVCAILLKVTDFCLNAAVTKEVIYMKSNSKLIKMILAALFLALAYIMPFLTGQIPDIGAMLCPMHIQVLL